MMFCRHTPTLRSAVLGLPAWMGVLLMLALAGCTTTSTINGEQVSQATAAASDIKTASDETDAERRSRVRLDLAAAYFARGQLSTALDEVKQSLAAFPKNAQAFNLRGLIYAGLGDTGLAEESFSQAIQLQPRDNDILQNYGWYLCQQGRFGEADRLFKQVLTAPQYPARARTMLSRGVCQARAGQMVLAVESLRDAFDLDPNNPTVSFHLADVLFKAGDAERARFYIRRVNAVSDLSSPASLWMAARIEHRLGNRSGVQLLGDQLHARFPQSREAARFDAGQFDE